MFVLGTSSVLMDAWDPQLAAELVAHHRVTASAGAPYYLASMIDAAEQRGHDLSSFTSYMVGAASVPPSLVERAELAGIPVYRAYGSSEHPVITTGCASDPLAKRAGTDGKTVPGAEIRLLEDGEIVSRGPDLFVGYTDARLDAESFLPDGWFCTGDIGRIDDDGFLTITDRKKDVIIRGGENIASKEVEDLLALHPSVVEAAVVGRPDPRYGERVAAFVRLRSDQTFTLDDARAHFAALGVARQKTPECVILVDELPRTASGKVRKVDLRTRFVGETGDD
jgi:acyl-CoA synthetase (AMP-forming)/AMP-acid ligase II